MSIRRSRVSGSVVTVVYDDEEEAPAYLERRLETELRRLFPAGCGVDVLVELAWTEEVPCWRLRTATVDLGGGYVEFGPGLIQSLRAVDLPLTPAGRPGAHGRSA